MTIGLAQVSVIDRWKSKSDYHRVGQNPGMIDALDFA